MICGFCGGGGKLPAIGLIQGQPCVVGEQPCAACGGQGIISCCDGAVGGPGDVANHPYDPITDSRDSYRDAIAELRRRFLAGERTPDNW